MNDEEIEYMAYVFELIKKEMNKASKKNMEASEFFRAYLISTILLTFHSANKEDHHKIKTLVDLCFLFAEKQYELTKPKQDEEQND